MKKTETTQSINIRSIPEYIHSISLDSCDSTLTIEELSKIIEENVVVNHESSSIGNINLQPLVNKLSLNIWKLNQNLVIHKGMYNEETKDVWQCKIISLGILKYFLGQDNINNDTIITSYIAKLIKGRLPITLIIKNMSTILEKINHGAPSTQIKLITPYIKQVDNLLQEMLDIAVLTSTIEILNNIQYCMILINAELEMLKSTNLLSPTQTLNRISELRNIVNALIVMKKNNQGIAIQQMNKIPKIFYNSLFSLRHLKKKFPPTSISQTP